MTRRPDVRLKRVYAEPADADGYRVLVDRVWPRGVSKDRADIDEWLKDVAPSTPLRQWFGHDPDRFEEFADRYRKELRGCEALTQLRQRCRDQDVVTLVYSAKDTQHNQAVVLRGLLTR